MSAQVDLAAILESAGADPHAPEGSIGWALAQVNAAVAELIDAVDDLPWQHSLLTSDPDFARLRAALARAQGVQS